MTINFMFFLRQWDGGYHNSLLLALGFVSMYVCVHVCMYEMHVCIHAHMYACVHECIYIGCIAKRVSSKEICYHDHMLDVQ